MGEIVPDTGAPGQIHGIMQTRYLRGVELHKQQSEIHFYKVVMT
eukprot:SAG11_NODE_6166_length_1373_cov_0.929356_1_plen_43_part_10